MSRWAAVRMVVAQVVDELFIELLCPVLLGLTLVQPVMRLRSPRPLFRDLVRQSGFVVCLAVIAGTLILVDLWSLAIVGESLVLVQCAVVLLLWPTLEATAVACGAKLDRSPRPGRGMGLDRRHRERDDTRVPLNPTQSDCHHLADDSGQRLTNRRWSPTTDQLQRSSSRWPPTFNLPDRSIETARSIGLESSPALRAAT